MKTTVQVLIDLNPDAKVLKPSQKIRHKKAQRKRVITGWRKWTPESIAERYNAKDKKYAIKLEYALDVISKVKRE